MKKIVIAACAIGLLASHSTGHGAGQRAETGAERIYRFVDGKGVTHLTNVPADARYRLYYHGEKQAPGRAAPAFASEPPPGFVPEPDVHTEEELLGDQDAGIPGEIHAADKPDSPAR